MPLWIRHEWKATCNNNDIPFNSWSYLICRHLNLEPGFSRSPDVFPITSDQLNSDTPSHHPSDLALPVFKSIYYYYDLPAIIKKNRGRRSSQLKCIKLIICPVFQILFPKLTFNKKTHWFNIYKSMLNYKFYKLIFFFFNDIKMRGVAPAQGVICLKPIYFFWHK